MHEWCSENKTFDKNADSDSEVFLGRNLKVEGKEGIEEF